MSDTKRSAQQWFEDAKQWGIDNGVGNMVLGALGAAGLGTISYSAGLSLLGGGGFIATSLALMIGAGGAVLGSVLFPGVVNSVTEKYRGEPFFPPAKGTVPQQQQTAEVAPAAPQSQAPEHALGQMAAPPTPEIKRPVINHIS